MEPGTVTANVADIQAAAAAAPQSATPQRAELNSREQFLQMLVTQLKNQDPLNPMESQEFSVQLAQFSQVEELLSINETLKSNNQANDALSTLLNNIMTTSLLGKDVLVDSNQFVHEEGTSNDLHFYLPEAAGDVTLTVRNAQGDAVAELDLGSRPAGNQVFTWDGEDGEGTPFLGGNYQFEVKAVNGLGDEITTTPFSGGRVSGVSIQNGTAYLTVNGMSYPAANVREILEPGS